MKFNETISAYPVKPRRSAGTLAKLSRNCFATTCILFGSIFGIAYAFLPSTRSIQDFARKNLYVHSEEYKLKKSRLAPFNNDGEDNNLQSAIQLPTIIDPVDSKSARTNISINDHLRVQPDQ